MALASWAPDTSGLLAAAGATVRFAAADAGGSKGNALWSSGGSGVYNVTLEGPSGAWVGVCPADRFAAGWAMKGLFFGGPGNLADGGALVASQWGPALNGGDVVSMRVEQRADAASVAFAVNGAGLGVAFDIEGWAGGALRPAVSLDAAGQAATLAVAAGALPPLAAFARAPDARAGVEGAWAGAWDLDVAPAGAGAWRLAARVDNSLSVRVAAAPGGGAGAVAPLGPVASTMMLPPPAEAAAEAAAAALLGALTALRRDGAELVLEGGGRAERFARRGGPAAARKEDVHWMG